MEKISVKSSRKFGSGVFAARKISKGESVFVLNGTRYHYNRRPFIMKQKVRNRAVQIGPDTWIFSPESAVHLTNHSCSPNVGVKGVRKFVALRDIEQNEELTWDYSTAEDADWYWKCRCGAENCRGIIGPWRELPASLKNKYLKMGIVSGWIKRREIR